MEDRKQELIKALKEEAENLPYNAVYHYQAIEYLKSGKIPWRYDSSRTNVLTGVIEDFDDIYNIYCGSLK